MVNTNKRVTTGRKSLFMFSFAALVVMATAVFLFWPSINDQARVAARVQSDESGRAAEIFSQVVRLDDAAGYAVYGGKGVDATGTSFRGAVGGGEGADLKGVDSAARGRSDIDAEVRKDLSAAYSAMRQLPCTTIEDGTLNDKTLGGGFYCVSGNTLERGLVFDAKGNAGAIFVVRVDGNFEARGGISLINGASQHNVYFAVDGDVMIGAGAEINGNIVSRGNIDVAEGSSVKGRTISIDGTVNARQAELGGGTGVIEICKFIETGTSLPAQNFTFTFPAVGGGTQSVSIPAGVCSAPREVVAGTVVITETYNGTFAISRATASRVGGVNVPTTVNIPAGTVSVNVLEGDLNNETTINVFNQPVRGGFIEICKFPSPITAPTATPVATPTPGGPTAAPEVVSGIFEFTFLTFPGGAIASVFVPVGSCSLPQQVTSFTAGTTTPSFPVTITEVGRPAILLESVTAVGGSPLTDRLVSVGGNIGIIGGGGTATVTVFAANAGNQTIVSFFNREAPGEIKVCKIAGPGVLVGTNFTFDVAGTVPGGTLTAPTFPGSLASFPVTVPAGPGPEGFCRFVRNAADTANQTFVVGRRVTIVERSVAGQTSPIVTRIDELNAGAPIVENLPARSVSFEVLLGTAVITYTNSSFTPGSLKVCKTGLGAAANVPSFTFDLSPTAAQAQFFEPGTNFGSVTVATNSCSPPILTLNADVDLLVDERPIGGTANTGTICQPGTCSIISTNTALGQANINLNTGITVNEVIFTNNTAAPAVAAPDFDFDGDGKSDPSIFRSTTGTWWVKGSTAGATATAFGSNGDIIAPADFDGDAKTDYAVYRAGTWHVLGSTAGYYATAFGLSGDIPQAGDYDGDRRADLAVYRPSNGTWYMLGSQVGFRAVNFGIATDLPTAADYDGDGRFDPAVYRDGAWYILGSTDGFRAFMFGVASDRPVQGDYDADGKADAAVYRNGTWHILRSTAGYAAYAFGMATDKPVPADYDGDRRADMAVYRPSNGVWHIMRSSVTESSAAYTSFAFGMETDTPVPY